jgi:nucleoid-associated protein YgaU
MTREIKVSLLVGLLFVIAIGILLSDHFRASQEPPPAVLDRAGATVRETVNAPGANSPIPPVTLAPDQISPRSAVQTPRDIEPPPSPVMIAPPAQQAGTLPQLPVNDPLAQAARQQGEELVPAESNSTPTAASGAQRTYIAKSGDSLSRMAARLLGGNTARNRQAIIAANASLQSNPNLVVAGQSYVIPGSATSAQLAAVVPGASGTGPAGTTASGGQWYYTVKEGDTLWRIATSQLGSPSAVKAIKELNADALDGGTTIQPGMKLRLPSAPVAVAD